MAVINGVGEQGWGSQYIDESGQWIQGLDETAFSCVSANQSGLSESGLTAFGDHAFEAATISAPMAAPAPAPTSTPLPAEVPASQAALALRTELAPAPAPAPQLAAAVRDPSVVKASAEELALASAVWRDTQASPYRLFQQMSEHGWNNADLGQAVGLSAQEVGDHLTRLGAPMGFGGAETLGRDAVNQPFMAALSAEQSQPDASKPWWIVTPLLDESGRPALDESGRVVEQCAFDTAAFATWYTSQPTVDAKNFARVHGTVTNDGAGGARLSSGANIVSGGYNEAGALQASSLSWAMDDRINQYQTFSRMNVLQQAAMKLEIDHPVNQAVIREFGGSQTLPENEMGERMRALYGTDLATTMLRLDKATAALKSAYLSAVNSAMSQPPASPDAPMPPGWTCAMVFGEDGNSVPHYRFDATAYQRWYVRQDTPQSRLFGQLFGTDVVQNASGFKTSGTLDSLSLSVAYDEDGNTTQVMDVSLSDRGMVGVDLGSPPDLYDRGQVYYLSGFGFVTSSQNIKPDEDWLDQLIPLVVMAAAAWFSAGVLGPAAAGAMGLTEAGVAVTATACTATTVLSTAGVIVSAAVAGAATSMVGGLLNGNLAFKDVLRGALSGALTAGLFQGVEGLTGLSMSNMSIPTSLAARTTVQGAVQALMGGQFKDGAVAGFASGLAGVLTNQLNSNILKAVDAGTLSASDATTARFCANSIGAALKIVASGSANPGFDLASAFLDQVFAQVDLPALPVGGEQAQTSESSLSLSTSPTSSLADTSEKAQDVNDGDSLSATSTSWDLSEAGSTTSRSGPEEVPLLPQSLGATGDVERDLAAALSVRTTVDGPDPTLPALTDEEPALAVSLLDSSNLVPLSSNIEDTEKDSSELASDQQRVQAMDVRSRTETLVAVGKGDTAIAIAKALYGDDWRAGLMLMLKENSVKLNADGSPVLRMGSTLRAPNLDDYPAESIDKLNRLGGDFVAGNTQALELAAARAQARAQAEQRSQPPASPGPAPSLAVGAPARPATDSASKPRTTVIEDLAIGFLGAANTVDRTISGLAGGLASVFSIDEADKVFRAMDERVAQRNAVFQGKEQGFSGKLVSAIPQILTAPFSASETGQELIKNGESVNKARAGALIDTAGNVIGMLLPGSAAVGSTAARRVVTGALSGAVINASQDVLVRESIVSIADTKESKTQFAPTWESTALAAVPGVAWGSMHGALKGVDLGESMTQTLAQFARGESERAGFVPRDIPGGLVSLKELTDQALTLDGAVRASSPAETTSVSVATTPVNAVVGGAMDRVDRAEAALLPEVDVTHSDSARPQTSLADRGPESGTPRVSEAPQAGQPRGSTLGDLTPVEIADLTQKARELGAPIYVTGSAARGERRNLGTDLPLAGFGESKEGTRSDIDYAVHPSAEEAAAHLTLPDVDPSFGVRGVDYLNLDKGPIIQFDPVLPPSVLDGAGRYYLLDPASQAAGLKPALDTDGSSGSPAPASESVSGVAPFAVVEKPAGDAMAVVSSAPEVSMLARSEISKFANELSAAYDNARNAGTRSGLFQVRGMEDSEPAMTSPNIRLSPEATQALKLWKEGVIRELQAESPAHPLEFHMLGISKDPELAPPQTQYMIQTGGIRVMGDVAPGLTVVLDLNDPSMRLTNENFATLLYDTDKKQFLWRTQREIEGIQAAQREGLLPRGVLGRGERGSDIDVGNIPVSIKEYRPDSLTGPKAERKLASLAGALQSDPTMYLLLDIRSLTDVQADAVVKKLTDQGVERARVLVPRRESYQSVVTGSDARGYEIW